MTTSSWTPAIEQHVDKVFLNLTGADSLLSKWYNNRAKTGWLIRDDPSLKSFPRLYTLQRLPHLNMKGHWKHASWWVIPSRLWEELLVMSTALQSVLIPEDQQIIDLLFSNSELNQYTRVRTACGCQVYRDWLSAVYTLQLWARTSALHLQVTIALLQ